MSSDEKAELLQRRVYELHVAAERLHVAMDAFAIDFAAESLPICAAGTRLYSQKDVADRLGVCERTVYELRLSGKLKAVYPTPRLLRYAEADLAAFVERLRQESTERA